MIIRCSGVFSGTVLFSVLSALLLFTTESPGQEGKDSTHKVVLPTKVVDALRARFPKAVIDKQTKEEEKGVVIYDLEFRQDSGRFEADYYEDGTLHNWERAISAADLPAAAVKAVKKKYPKAVFKEIMAITEVKDGKEALQGYEILLSAKDKKEYEVTVAPDGTILEDTGDGR